MSTRKVIIYKGKLYFSDVTVPTRVSQLANDAGYVTTDEKVKQTPTTEDAIYRILLSGDTDDTEHVNKVFKNANLTYNPSTSQLKLSKTYIGNILANITADPKYLTIQQYVNNVSIGYLQLNFNDIYNDNKWDGTHTSLKDTITYLVNKAGDTWTLINVYDCNSSTNATISIPSGAKELHIEYGSKNNTQIYGGASVNTLVQSKLGSSHPIFVPIYKDSGTNTVAAVMYFFWNGNIFYYARPYGSITCRFSVHWR